MDKFKKYIYIGVFIKGKLIYQIGNKVLLSSNVSNNKAIIAMVDYLITEIEKNYTPIGNEYIAYDYSYVESQ